MNTKQILDVGCGRGAKVKSLQKVGQVTGIDISPEFIDQCQKLFPKSRFLVMDGENLQFPAQTFDSIYCCDVIEHVNHPLVLLQNIFRVLKHTGTLYLDIPYFKSEKLLKVFNPTYAQQVHHQSVFSFADIIRLLNQSHFQIAKCHYSKFFDNIYLLHHFLQNKKIQNQQGDLTVDTDIDKLMSYLVQHIYSSLDLTHLTKTKEYSFYNQISFRLYHLDLINFLHAVTLFDRLFSPSFPKTISLQCHPLISAHNQLSLLTPPSFPNLSRHPYVKLAHLRARLVKLQQKKSLLQQQIVSSQQELKIIYDSHFYRLWPVYEKLKNIFRNRRV